MSILRKSKKKSLQPTISTLEGKAYPISGIFYITEKGTFYIKSSKRYKVFSDRCFSSWNVKAIDASFAQISHIPYAGILGFRDGTIIHNLGDGKIYVVSDNKRLHIKDQMPSLKAGSRRIRLQSMSKKLTYIRMVKK